MWKVCRKLFLFLIHIFFLKKLPRNVALMHVLVLFILLFSSFRGPLIDPLEIDAAYSFHRNVIGKLTNEKV